MECTIIGTVAFTCNYFKMVEKSWYSFLTMLFIFMELFVAHFLGPAATSFWTVAYLTIFTFNKEFMYRHYVFENKLYTDMFGRYVAKYCNIKKFRLSRLWFSLLGSILLTFMGNIVATLVRGEISWPFSRECSITTLLIGVLMCMIALHGTGNSKVINAIAKYTFHIYLLNNALILFIRRYIVADSSSISFMLEVIIEAVLICSVCGLIAMPLDKIAKLFVKIFDKVENVFLQFLNWSMTYIEEHC